jgi:hypothetical protein
MLNDDDLSTLLGRTFKSATSGLTVPADLPGSVIRSLKVRRRVRTTGVASVAVAATCATVIAAQLPDSTSRDANSATRTLGPRSYHLVGYQSPAMRRAVVDVPCLPDSADVPHGADTNGRIFVVSDRLPSDRPSTEHPPAGACFRLIMTPLLSRPTDTEPVPGHDDLYFGAPYGTLRSGYLRAAVWHSGGDRVFVRVWADRSVSDHDFIEVLTAAQQTLRALQDRPAGTPPSR